MSGGYCHPDYVNGLREFGDPIRLTRSGGSVLSRIIPNSQLRDAMGGYPLFCCANWNAIGQDLAVLSEDHVSIVLVTEPFTSPDESFLKGHFDFASLYAMHYIADLEKPSNEVISKHHRYYIRLASKTIDVEIHEQPTNLLEDWQTFFQYTISKNSLSGIKTYSKNSFETHLSMPGTSLFVAHFENTAVGMLLCFQHADYAYLHLVGVSPLGFEKGASYAMYSSAMEYFRKRARWLSFGGTVYDIRGNLRNGLDKFKAGWTNDVLPSYLCGKILQPDAYQSLSSGIDTDYFPAYRSGELSKRSQPTEG